MTTDSGTGGGGGGNGSFVRIVIFNGGRSIGFSSIGSLMGGGDGETGSVSLGRRDMDIDGIDREGEGDFDLRFFFFCDDEDF